MDNVPSLIWISTSSGLTPGKSTFTSTAFRQMSTRRGKVDGQFTLMGKTKPVTFDVEPGQSVNSGGAAAVELAKAQALVDALDGAVSAAVSAAAPIVPPAGDGGTAAFAAFKTAWDLAKINVPTTKAKGE